jgi:hypothetical protein
VSRIPSHLYLVNSSVGTNHFGHFYLHHLLQTKSALAKNAHVTVTASAVHDPDSPGGKQGTTATLGDLQGLQDLGRACEMIDGGVFNADKAYKDSKVRVSCLKTSFKLRHFPCPSFISLNLSSLSSPTSCLHESCNDDWMPAAAR